MKIKNNVLKITLLFVFVMIFTRIISANETSEEDNSTVETQNIEHRGSLHKTGGQASIENPSLKPAGKRVSSSEHPILKVSLDDVSWLALENSLDIQIAEFDYFIAKTSLRKAESIFDAFLDGGLGYRNDKKKPASKIFGTKTIETTYNLGLQKKFPYGTGLSVDLHGNRLDSNSDFVEMDPQQEAVAGLSLVQSLGKNYFGIADRSAIKITKIGIENAAYTSLDDIEKALYSVQVAYWTLVLRMVELKIKEDMLGKAEELYMIYKDKFSIGISEKVDIIAARSNMKVRESDVLIAKLRVETAKNDLLFLLNSSDTYIMLEPKDSLEIVPYSANMSDALKEAIENRRDYKIVKNAIDANNINIKIKENALWPEIDLQASLAKNGLTQDFMDSWDEVIEDNNTEFAIGIIFKIPLGNNFAKAELEETKLLKQQLILSLKKVERIVLREINNRVSEINTYKNQIEMSSEIVALEEGKLEEEIKRLKYGRSSSDLIIRYGNDVLDVRLAFAQSFFMYRISLLDLELAQNTLLGKYWEEEEIEE